MADEKSANKKTLKKEQHAVPDKKDRETVEQFCLLMEKARKLFDGLRDLPQFCQSHWQPHFGRTFDAYTKLWNFQQEHRSVLDHHYNLKRWQIGDIASKIGQLYYNYYLRTSESNYLFEAFQFYSAIRTRNYFSQTDKDERPGMLVKRLRYYARFLVVCLLLNEVDLVRDLVKELKHYVTEYSSTIEGNDQAEWQLVLKEAIAFIEADSFLTVMGEDVMPVTLKHRVFIEKIPLTKSQEVSKLKLQEVIIVGNCEKQTKFSELTLDMFRFLQCVEKEPESLQSYKIRVSNSEPGKDKAAEEKERSKNPHKYLLYKPSFGQLMTFLSAGFKDLPLNGIMMLYLSADAASGNKNSIGEVVRYLQILLCLLKTLYRMCHKFGNENMMRQCRKFFLGKFLNHRAHLEAPGFYEAGGVATSRRREHGHSKRMGSMKEAHCLFPEDMIAFTRKPLVIVIDSPNSFAFKSIPKLFGQPLICFMSPVEYPEDIKGGLKNGGLFTLFCYDPLLAFCTICNLTDLRHELWMKCREFVDKILAEELEIMYTHIKEMDCAFEQFLGDDFIRLLILRFIFCYQTLRIHKHFKGCTYYPSTSPPLSKEIFNHKGFTRHLLELASMLDVRNFFNEFTEISGFDLGAM